MWKKLSRVFYSMKLGIILLVLIAVACTAGSLIPQGERAAAYTASYGETGAKIIRTLCLDRVFTCWWFIILVVLLCVNLLLCSVARFPKIRRRYRTQFSPEYHLRHRDSSIALRTDPESAGKVWEKMGFRQVVSREIDGRNWCYGVKNRAGIWGSWLCHVGMLMIILGFAAGQMLSTEETVYGVPGQEKAIGDTGYVLRIDDFNVDLREDYTVEQYRADLTVSNEATGESTSGSASVNHPMSAFGMRLYQNSTGWAASVSVYKNDEPQKTQVLCAGETVAPDDFQDLVFVFTKFFPDYTNENGTPSTKTPLLNNPHAIFQLYYQGELLAMNEVAMDAPVTVDDYKFVLSEPQQYTLIQIVKDPTMGFVALGGLVTLLALLLSFYVRTEEIWFCQEESKDGCVVYGKCRKGGAIFEEKLKEAVGGSLPREEKEKTDEQ